MHLGGPLQGLAQRARGRACPLPSHRGTDTQAPVVLRASGQAGGYPPCSEAHCIGASLFYLRLDSFSLLLLQLLPLLLHGSLQGEHDGVLGSSLALESSVECIPPPLEPYLHQVRQQVLYASEGVCVGGA